MDAAAQREAMDGMKDRVNLRMSRFNAVLSLSRPLRLKVALLAAN